MAGEFLAEAAEPSSPVLFWGGTRPFGSFGFDVDVDVSAAGTVIIDSPSSSGMGAQ